MEKFPKGLWLFTLNVLVYFSIYFFPNTITKQMQMIKTWIDHIYEVNRNLFALISTLATVAWILYDWKVTPTVLFGGKRIKAWFVFLSRTWNKSKKHTGGPRGPRLLLKFGPDPNKGCRYGCLISWSRKYNPLWHGPTARAACRVLFQPIASKDTPPSFMCRTA